MTSAKSRICWIENDSPPSLAIELAYAASAGLAGDVDGAAVKSASAASGIPPRT